MRAACPMPGLIVRPPVERPVAPRRSITTGRTPMPEPAPTKFTNLDATTTWCRTCDLAVSMPHEHPITVPFAAVVNRVTPTKPTPTVIASDKALAARWFRSSPGDISAASALEAKMATEIAATREAWGVPREAVAGLVEGATKALYHWNEGHDHDACEVPGELRAALERVREGGSARE